MRELEKELRRRLELQRGLGGVRRQAAKLCESFGAQPSKGCQEARRRAGRYQARKLFRNTWPAFSLFEVIDGEERLLKLV